MGRHAKPTALKLISGNPGKRALPKSEPQAKGDITKVPAHLSKGAKAEWRFVLEHAPAGVLKLIDSSTLETFCIARDLHRIASKQMQQEQLIVTSPVQGIPMANPLLAVINRQAEIILKSAGVMGFTPVSRSKVSVDSGPKKPTGFSEFGD